MQHHRRGRALLQRCGALLDAAQHELEEAAVEDLPDAASDAT
jgi:exonuclease VII small subunit